MSLRSAHIGVVAIDSVAARLGGRGGGSATESPREIRAAISVYVEIEELVMFVDVREHVAGSHEALGPGPRGGGPGTGQDLIYRGRRAARGGGGGGRLPTSWGGSGSAPGVLGAGGGPPDDDLGGGAARLGGAGP